MEIAEYAGKSLNNESIRYRHLRADLIDQNRDREIYVMRNARILVKRTIFLLYRYYKNTFNE